MFYKALIKFFLKKGDTFFINVPDKRSDNCLAKMD